MTQEKNLALGVLVLLVVVIMVTMAYRHRRWMMKNCICDGSSSSGKFHGWRYQHYDDNPYNGQHYHCGIGAKGAHYPNQTPPSVPPRSPNAGAEGFAADDGHWPTAGTFGNLADTNPYGNYAGHVDMYYPTYYEGYVEDVLWTKT